MKEDLKILEARGISVFLQSEKKKVPLLKNISLSLAPGEILGVVGKSGAGKTMLVRSLAGLLPALARITEGEIRYRGRRLGHGNSLTWQSLWGKDVFVMFQSAAQALNPCLTLGTQLEEAIVKGRKKRSLSMGPGSRRHKGRTRAGGIIKIFRNIRQGTGLGADPDDLERLLSAVGLSSDLAPGYPFEISGGMRQRVQVAMAIALGPRVLIADEPCTGLDPENQAAILALLAGLNREQGTSIILVSHDIRSVADLCSRVLILDQGQVVETGTPQRVLSMPGSAAAVSLKKNLELLEGGSLCRTWS